VAVTAEVAPAKRKTQMTKYTEAADKKKDAKMTKGLSKKEKSMFEKMDKKHRKPKSLEDDAAQDRKIIKKVKAQRKKG
jgi:hypothetical protein